MTTITTAVLCGALSWDPNRQVLWCGAYDGTGEVYTVDPTTGAASPQFVFVFGSGENCFGQAPGYIDGLGYDPSDGTLWLSDDGSTVLHHVDIHGNTLGSWDTPELLCNSGIAIDTYSGNTIWLAVFTSPSESTGYFAAVSKANPQLLQGTVPYQGSGVPEGIAFDFTSFKSRCALWSNSASSVNQIVATNLAPYCP